MTLAERRTINGAGEGNFSDENPNYASKRDIRKTAMEIRRVQVVYLDDYPDSDPFTLEFNPRLSREYTRVTLGFDFDDKSRMNVNGIAFMTIAEDSNGITEPRRDIVIDLATGQSGVLAYDSDKKIPLKKTAPEYRKQLREKTKLRKITADEVAEVERIIEDLRTPWEILKRSAH